MKKLIVFPFILVLLIISLILLIRFTLGGSEDSWICQDGQWIKHGQPSSSMPATPCGENADQIIGGDTDEHGCLLAAGYSWCQTKQTCLRAWEEFCGPSHFDPIFSLMIQLRDDTQTALTVPEPGSFDWLLYDASAAAEETLLIPGLSQSPTQTMTIDQVSTLLTINGFIADEYNTSTSNNGFIKGNTICLLQELTEQDIDQDSPANLILSCGFLP